MKGNPRWLGWTQLELRGLKRELLVKLALGYRPVGGVRRLEKRH